RKEIGQRPTFCRRVRVQRKVHPLDLHIVLGLELFNTHGTEVAPGSHVVGKYSHRHRLAHAASLSGQKVRMRSGFVASPPRCRKRRNRWSMTSPWSEVALRERALHCSLPRPGRRRFSSTPTRE